MIIPPADTLLNTDTSTVCTRNSISGVSFYDKGSFIRNLSVPGGDKTIINLSERAETIRAEQKVLTQQKLRNGENLPQGQPDNDFIIIVLVVAVFLLSIVRSSLKNFQPVTRFFLFRGLNENNSGDTNVLFHWQTTLLNTSAFFIISLFTYRAVILEGGIPNGLNGILFWFISLIIIIAILTMRHIICSIAGNLSGQRDAFNEYLIGIYQSYHFTALVLFVLIIISTYSGLLPSRVYVIAGICGFGVMYLIRAMRLLLIFMNRNISIFYLILYLCALEILPLAIVIRYFTAPVKIG